MTLVYISFKVVGDWTPLKFRASLEYCFDRNCNFSDLTMSAKAK